jgi:hypothetical protein
MHDEKQESAAASVTINGNVSDGIIIGAATIEKMTIVIYGCERPAQAQKSQGAWEILRTTINRKAAEMGIDEDLVLELVRVRIDDLLRAKARRGERASQSARYRALSPSRAAVSL